MTFDPGTPAAAREATGQTGQASAFASLGGASAAFGGAGVIPPDLVKVGMAQQARILAGQPVHRITTETSEEQERIIRGDPGEPVIFVLLAAVGLACFAIARKARSLP